ncbi:hypothetical protein [Fictibacillus gelatini]|uniref:hypothetical protein n=1 Tax=Fictibacillus gelatini TaxID=225985 RepID=UPI0004053923|nr:hypothetical protein [Fictibacillus gelatini]
MSNAKNEYEHLKGKILEIEVSGKNFIIGKLLDYGPDIFVIHNGKDFLYVPSIHLQRIQVADEIAESSSGVDFQHLAIDYSEESPISLRKILMNAKGQFVQVYVTGNKSIHGYVTNIMNDYFVFYSPIYKTTFISLQHLKWLIPYRENHTPYSLNDEMLPVRPATVPLSRTFEEQCKRMQNNLVVFDLGENTKKIGLLKDVVNNKIKLVSARGETVYWNLQHLKTLHTP